MKQIVQAIIVSMVLLFGVQAAQAALMPIAHDFANSSFVEVGQFDPDPSAVTGTAEDPHIPPPFNPPYEPIPFGMKSASAQVTHTGDSYFETWFGFNLASAASVNLNTAGSVDNSPSPVALDTILALYFGDVNNGALVDGRQNDNCSAVLVTSCLTFDNLAAGDYIAGVSIIANGEFLPNWMTSDPIEAYLDGVTKLNISVAAPSAVPVPAAVWLFGTALIGFFCMSRRRSIKT
jgi:hypothetical protein